MTAQSMWDAYVATNPDAQTYTARAFSGQTSAHATTLAALVRTGVKTATSSAYDAYAAQEIALPEVGSYYVVVDEAGNAVCVTKTTSVATMPFCDVTAAYAQKEGEPSLCAWRADHQVFFTAVLAEYNKPFFIRMPTVCEEFELVYAAPEETPAEVVAAEPAPVEPEATTEAAAVEQVAAPEVAAKPQPTQTSKSSKRKKKGNRRG